MKILLCHNFYQSRGGEAQAVLAEKELLEKKGHDVIFFSRDNKEINKYGFFQKIYLFFNSLFSLKTYREVKKIIEKEKPNIVHIHNVFPLISPSVYYAAKSCGVPVVQTVHNYRFLCPNGLFLNNKSEICEKCKKSNYFHAVIRKCYRNSYVQSFLMAITIFVHRQIGTFEKKTDVFIAPSRFLKKKLVEGGFPENKIVVKPNFIDIENMKKSESEDYILYMGRLSREKGLFTLLKAFKSISQSTLKIMGEGPLRTDMEKFIREEGISNVQFLGFINGKKRFEILGKAKILVIPSECYENMPFVALESFACGVPVVVSNIGGLFELIENEKTGLLFEMGNAIDLRNKIEKLISNRKLLEQMRYNARKCAEEKYSEEIVYKKIIEVYKKLARDNFRKLKENQ